MDIRMGIDYGLQYILALASFLTGAFIGLVYDLFRISRMFFLKNKWLIFFEDILFCFIVSGLHTLIFYNFSYGKVRLYAFIFSIGGFCLYYFTLGRYTKKACEKIHSIAKPRIDKIKMWIYNILKRTKRSVYTSRYCRIVALRAGQGFGLIEKTGRKYKKNEKKTAAE